MLIQLQKWRRFAGFIGFNLSVALLAYMCLFQPALAHLDGQRRAIEQKRTALVRATSLAVRRDQILRNQTDVEGLLTRPFIQGEAISHRSADLLIKLRKIAQGFGLSFDSISSIEAREAHAMEFVGARVEMTAPAADLARLLATLESNWPFLFVASARLVQPPGAESRNDRVAAVLDIYGATQRAAR